MLHTKKLSISFIILYSHYTLYAYVMMGQNIFFHLPLIFSKRSLWGWRMPKKTKMLITDVQKLNVSHSMAQGTFIIILYTSMWNANLDYNFYKFRSVFYPGTGGTLQLNVQWTYSVHTLFDFSDFDPCAASFHYHHRDILGMIDLIRIFESNQSFPRCSLGHPVWQIATPCVTHLILEHLL